MINRRDCGMATDQFARARTSRLFSLRKRSYILDKYFGNLLMFVIRLQHGFRSRKFSPFV